MLTIKDVRDEFAHKLLNSKFTSVNREQSMTDITGSSTLELTGTSILIDEDSIFGTVNQEYVKREEEWYCSQSLNVNDFPGGAPTVWKSVADLNGYINSNYGWCVFSPDNSVTGINQYTNVLNELVKNKESRRAIMIYTRPSMWSDYNKNGRSDFMCTNTVQYMIRDGVLNAVVNMRSNDVVFGFKNDLAWQRYVHDKLAKDLSVTPGSIIWQTGSLHVYARHYYLVDHFAKTGETTITKALYQQMYPNSNYA